MTTQVWFVDLENVQKIDLSRVPPDARVMVFYGMSQKRLPVELVMHAQPLGARLKWIKISGEGSNALDFHIAYYLGQELAAAPVECVIISHDTGFDPLMRHLVSLGHACRRVSTVEHAIPAIQAPPDEASFARLVMLLKKEPARPARSKGLAGKIKSWFPMLPEAERRALAQRLFAESWVRESGTSLSYHL